MEGILGNKKAIVVCSEDGADGAKALVLAMLHLCAHLGKHKSLVKNSGQLL